MPFRLRQFARKQTRRIRDYFSAGTAEDVRVYPWHRFRRAGIARFLVATITVFPLLWQSLAGYSRTRDAAAFLHPAVCWVTLFIYGYNYVFARGKPLSRDAWQTDPLIVEHP